MPIILDNIKRCIFYIKSPFIFAVHNIIWTLHSVFLKGCPFSK